MTEARPLVSILTPSFQQGRFLGDCLSSIANQTYDPIEHIVCDGGSTDGSVELLEAAPETVRWISEPDDGQSDALNKALAMSSGEIIGWINSDDGYADVRTVEWAVQAFESDPGVDVVFGDVLLVDEANVVLQYYRIPPRALWLLRFGAPLMQPGVFFRRRATESGFVRRDLDVVMDAEFWLRLAGVGCKFRRVGRPFAIDRHHRDRKSYALLDKRRDERRRVDTEYGLNTGTSLLVYGKLARSVQRIAGLGPTLGLERSLRPAFPLRLDARPRRALRQVLVPRRFMAATTGRP